MAPGSVKKKRGSYYIENENGDITYEITTTTDEEDDAEEGDDDEETLRAKYTPEYFQNKQKLIFLSF